jgi:membrane protein involved in colicin uptake
VGRASVYEFPESRITAWLHGGREQPPLALPDDEEIGGSTHGSQVRHRKPTNERAVQHRGHNRSMAKFKAPDFAERQKASAESRKAALEKFRAAPGPDDPEFAKRQAAREAVHAARDARAAEREAAKKARDTALAEQAARDAELAAQASREAAEQAARDAAEQAERDRALEAERKAARDARYAARKARKGK